LSTASSSKPNVSGKTNQPQVLNQVRPHSSQPPTSVFTKQNALAADTSLKQIINKDLSEYESIVQTFRKEKWDELFDNALAVTKSLAEQAGSALSSLTKTKESRVKHVFEFHSKLSMAVACFIFLFVGAPMGAIVRKGGFGWPLLISIVFFMMFIVITIFSKNIAERFVINAVLASWMNCLIIFPMGLALTYWAMRDMTMQQLADFLKIKLPTPTKKTIT
jgi:lipopolysaccharide export system permease protein